MSTKITTSANPDSRKNWILSVEITDPVHIRLRLVPDKLIADHSSLKNHIDEIINKSWSSPEEMSLTIIENINNELIPKWLEVIYVHEGVSVKIEDRQPGLAGFNPPEE